MGNGVGGRRDAGELLQDAVDEAEVGVVEVVDDLFEAFSGDGFHGGCWLEVGAVLVIAFGLG